MFHTRLFATVFVAAMLSIGALTTPATAADGSGANDPCPLSHHGAGTILKTELSITPVMVGRWTDQIEVLADSAKANIICTTAKNNYVDHQNENGTLFYGARDTVGTDTIRVGAVDENDMYYTAEYSVDVFAVELTAPTVVQTLKLDKKGKVVRKAIIKVYGSPTYDVQVMGGSFMEENPDVISWAVNNRAVRIKTARPAFDFVLSVSDGFIKGGEITQMNQGQINTKTGHVTMENMWFTADKPVTAAKHTMPGAPYARWLR